MDECLFRARRTGPRDGRVALGSHDITRHVEIHAAPRQDVDALAGEEGDSPDSVVPDVDECARDATPGDEQESLWERFEESSEDAFMHRSTQAQQDDSVANDGVSARGEGQDNAAIPPGYDAELLDIDYKSLWSEGLRYRDMDLVARCLLAAEQADDMAFVRSISQETFSEALSVLEPANNIDMLVTTHVELSPHMEKLFGLAPMQRVSWEYAQLFDRIVRLRRNAGVALTPEDFNTLLRSARDVGHKDLAVRTWHALLASGNLPTVQSWNYYMSTALFDRLRGRTTGHRMRVIPFNLHARKAANPNPFYANYRVGKHGVEHVINRTFNQMLRDGVDANEESYRIVITAAAREGEIGVVKTILRKVWDVDVDAIMAGSTQEEALAPKQMPTESGEYPSDLLLFTIAHAFSINNDIPAALRLVDFVSRHYKLTVSQDTWAHLFEWTFVLATPRSGGSKVNRQGQLPLQSPLDVWNTMIGEPYCVRPTIGMYSQLIQNLYKRKLTPLMMEKMDEGLQLHLEHIAKCKKLWRALKRTVKLLSRTGDQAKLAAKVSSLRQQHDHAELLRKRNRFWIKRWVRLLLGTMRTRATTDIPGDFALRHIPSLLRKFEVWAPSTVRYDTAGGILEFKLREEEQIARFHENILAMAIKQKALMEAVPRLVGEGWLRCLQPKVSKRVKRRGMEGVMKSETAVPQDLSEDSHHEAGRMTDVAEDDGEEEAVR